MILKKLFPIFYRRNFSQESEDGILKVNIVPTLTCKTLFLMTMNVFKTQPKCLHLIQFKSLSQDHLISLVAHLKKRNTMSLF